MVSDTQKLKQQNSERVREHLANERTYLAWMRSAISLMGFSLVIMRLRYSQTPQTPHPGNSWELSLVFTLVGLVTALLSTQHYFAVRYAINSNTQETSSRWVILFSLVVTLLGAGVMYLAFM
jgi:putative membrane protein